MTSQLARQEHTSLRVLTRNLDAEDAKYFLTAANLLREPGDRSNVEAVLQVSMPANREIYQRIRGDERMCEAMRELMKDEIEAMNAAAMQQGMAQGMEKGMAQGLQKGLAQGLQKGLAQGALRGRLDTLVEAVSNLVRNAGFNLEQAMQALNISAAEWPAVKAQLEAAK